MQQTINAERKREAKCYHAYCCLPLNTEINLFQFMYEQTGHAYAVNADKECAYLTSPIADED